MNPPMLRLLYYCPTVGSHGYAGSQRTLEFASALSRNGVTVFLSSPYLKKQCTLSKNMTLVPVPGNPYGLIRGLKKIAAENKINVILERLEGAHLVFNGYGAVIGRLLNISSACEIHVPPSNLQTRITSFPWLRNSLKNSKKVFIISQNAAKMLYLHSKYLNAKTIVIPNGFDSSKLVNKLDAAKVIKEYLPKGKKIVCYFGELSEDKGIDLILEVINSDSSNYYFVIGGWGPYESIMRELAKEKPDKIRYLGKVPKEKIFAYLQLSDLSLSLYRRTQLGGIFFGQPLKVYESLAAGTNVLVTSKMNLPDELFNLCTLTEPNLQDVKRKMYEACTKKQDKNWQRNVKKNIQPYSWDNIAHQIFVPALRSLALENEEKN
jgi:glycosyltransferase involved in cell wall biosynthesis